MSKYKILFKISGSIAAYKSAYVISKLVQNGFEVKTVATESALKFIGKATFEGLTGNPVYTDSFADGEMMSHINLMKWADLIILCPASANTINKLANGIGDNLLTALFLAFDWSKPYLIVLAMNTNMFDHPATQSSLRKLNEWGVKILPTAEGYLACGDTGRGKLLEPDEIYEYILLALNQKTIKPAKKLKVLITSGGTKENIDGVRFISNLSTGKTAASIADYFLRRGHDVTYLHTFDAAVPKSNCVKAEYLTFSELDAQIKNILGKDNFDAAIHLAAVSDYSLDSIEVSDQNLVAPLKEKIDSESEKLILNLKKNPKIIDSLRSYSKNKNLKVVGFKLTNNADEQTKVSMVRKLVDHSNCDYVVLNDKNDRNENVQVNFKIFNKTKETVSCKTSTELAGMLEEFLTNA
ncbi:MAG: bifunctional phosphopantothenoylcysteine decarboxylase/phosphopantothenate--cysteine ligase CoaBC [Bacteroidetes bacterium]|nr:bifunctional phosphopantothenoylcysteine decarboxylase/phosphopantothenate--cysteine ligase CoaBC [Bacteroidota bacterium]MCL6097581.1 bifunctional phosphopantothenoylcysteine decarboxylase/phosphopantothenate--cysteine ligase CoaBC [Bacteroidota bacterium]